MFNFIKKDKSLKHFEKVFANQINIKKLSICFVVVVSIMIILISAIIVLINTKGFTANAIEVAVPLSTSGYNIKSINGTQTTMFLDDADNLEGSGLEEGDNVELEIIDNSASSWKTLNAEVKDNSLTAKVPTTEVCYWECYPASTMCYPSYSKDPNGSNWAFQLCAHTSVGDAVGVAECQQRGMDLCEPGCYDFNGFRDYCCIPGDSGCFNLKLQCTVTYIGYYIENGIGYHHWSVTNDGLKLSEYYQRWLGEFKAPEKGGIEVEKESNWSWASQSSSLYSLNNTKYYVYENQNDAINRTNPVGKIVLNNNGKGIITNLIVKSTPYYIRESNIEGEYGVGYNFNEDIGSAVLTPNTNTKVKWSDNRLITTNDAIINNFPIKLIKTDSQTKENGATLGLSKSFAQAEFSVEYKEGILTSKESFINYNIGRHYEWKIITDKDGFTGIGKGYEKLKISGPDYPNFNNSSVAPVGTYIIKEIKPPEGYLISNVEYLVIIDFDKKSYNGTKITYYNLATNKEVDKLIDEQSGFYYVQYMENSKRGDYKFNKINNKNMLLKGIPFKITSKTTGEWHIIVSDENGIVDTSNSHIQHSKSTNGNDIWYDEKNNKFIDESKLSSNCGIWFGLNKKNLSICEPIDDVGALPYDNYIVEEIETSNNKKYLPFEIREFSILDNNVRIEGPVWINTEVTPILTNTTDENLIIIALFISIVLCYIIALWVYCQKY